MKSSGQRAPLPTTCPSSSGSHICSARCNTWRDVHSDPRPSLGAAGLHPTRGRSVEALPQGVVAFPASPRPGLARSNTVKTMLPLLPSGDAAPCPRALCVLLSAPAWASLETWIPRGRQRPAPARPAPAPRLRNQCPWPTPPSSLAALPLSGTLRGHSPPFLLGTFPRLGLPADFPWFWGLLSRSMLNPSFLWPV